mmetsp:Transcript_22454/g.36259  ORF Transcript_22454/g.36259 Transcript_22454/m.36259 type:complete len:331 (-) Transcript_22454:1630-2622(-)
MEGQEIGDSEPDAQGKDPGDKGVFEGVEEDPVGHVRAKEEFVILKVKGGDDRKFSGLPKADHNDHRDWQHEEKHQHRHDRQGHQPPNECVVPEHVNAFWREGGWAHRHPSRGSSGRDELVPFADHVLVFVHDRVPTGHSAHAILKRPAIAQFARQGQRVAGGGGDGVGRGFALEPIAPFVFGHVVLGGFWYGRVIALAHQVSANPTVEIPVDVLIGRVAFQARQCRRQTDPTTPRPVTFFEGLVDAGHALRLHCRDGRRPHGLDHNLARGHQVHALVERFPKGAELTVFLGLGKDRHGQVDLFAGHVALVGIGVFAHRLDDHRHVHNPDA